MAPPPLLALSGITLARGGPPLLKDAELVVMPGERLGLVGRNGSGKSTLLRVMAGLVAPDAGTRLLGPGATLRYLEQEPDLGAHPTTLAYAAAGLAPGDDPRRALVLLQSLGLTGEEPTGALSGGESRRAALARALAPEPDLLLLDEPTNHLDLPAIEWLEGHLARRRGALVLVSHDRRFLAALTRATAWVDRARVRRFPVGFADFEAARDAALEQEEAEAQRLGRKIAAEEHWMRHGVTGRRKRNLRRVDELRELRQQRQERRGPEGRAAGAASEASASGALVIEAKGAGVSLGGRPLVRDLDVRVARGDRLGIVGANGAGKTTLVRLLTGALAPDEGVVRLGTNLEVAGLDQKRAALAEDGTVADVLTEGRGDQVFVNGEPRHVIGYLKDFLFPPERARAPVSALSGGERGRLLLARALAKPSNLLVLDEPTNDLDLETLDLLQEVLAGYKGTVLLVSHDRDLLDRVADAVLVAEGDGRWTPYAGGYADMLAQRGAAAPARREAMAPARRTKGEPRGAAPATPPVPAPPPARRPRLGPKERHELTALPARIAALDAALVKIRAALADPALAARDRARYAALAEAAARAEGEIAAAETRWLELEEAREAVEG